jgi:hypothetical protein
MIPGLAVLVVVIGCVLWALFATRRGEPRYSPAQKIIRWRYRAAHRSMAAARALDVGYHEWRLRVAEIRVEPVNEMDFPPVMPPVVEYIDPGPEPEKGEQTSET